MGLDPHDLARFVTAQNTRDSYAKALAEIKAGKKTTHWIWYILPQFVGLSTSGNGKKYAINSIEEARAYIVHPVLGPRLLEMSQAVLDSKTATARALMGTAIDDTKLQSCMTLFGLASQESIFSRIIQKYYPAGRDQKTVDIWKRMPSAS